jgi:hypothetical protein
VFWFNASVVKIGDDESLLCKIGFSTQRRKGRKETDFLFGGERLPNKKASVTLG